MENQTGSTVVCAELTDSEIQPDRTTFANDADPNLPKIIVNPENSTEIEKETTKGKTTLSWLFINSSIAAPIALAEDTDTKSPISVKIHWEVIAQSETTYHLLDTYSGMRYRLWSS